MGGGAQTLEDHAWGKGKHDNFVRMSIDRLTLNYPLVLTHTAFACITPYDYGADSGNELTIGGIVSGPDGDLTGIIVDYIIHYIDSTTEIRVARTDETGIYGAAYPVTKEIAYIEFSMLNENEFPKYKGVKTISIYDFTGQPPIGDKEVQIEKNSVTGKPFVGIATDATSTLKITLSFPGCTNVKISKGRHGEFEGDCVASDRMIQLDSNGQAEIIYRPRPTIHKGYLTPHLDVHKLGPKISVSGVQLHITYTDAYERDGEIRTNFYICRPPVMLVHGFVGGPDTWDEMSKYLQNSKYDTYMGDYYATNQNIESLAGTLKVHIQKQKLDYANANIKLTKVDVIGHSMGGLIARSYTTNKTIYLDDVRKLITIGTPHRGSSWIDVTFGRAIAAWFATHKTPALQLSANSPFLQKLNKGWDIRDHLNPKVQHGNIYGFPSDLVVSADSAYLNGVVEHIVFDVKHSSVIDRDLTAITESTEINERVERWLQCTLLPKQLKGMKATIYEYTGDISVGIPKFPFKKVESAPTNINSYVTLRTEHDATAIVHLSLLGQVWGIILLDEDSEITIGAFSPKLVEICLSKGSATFSSNKDTHFTVPVKIKKVGAEEWWNYHPQAVVTGLDTEFAITAGEEIEIHCLEGKLIVDTQNATGGGTILSANDSMTVKVETVVAIDDTSEDELGWSIEDDEIESPLDTPNAEQHNVYAGFKLPPTEEWGRETWFNTQINVTSEQTISVTASGTVQPSISSDIFCGPNGTFEVGYWLTAYSPRSDLGHAALIARIGETGDIIFIGTNTSFVAPTDGELWLGINDYDGSNNLGEFVAEICIGEETPTPTPSGSGTSYLEATLTHSGFDFSEGTTGEYPIRDGEVIFWQPGAATHPDYPDYSGYLWWRNTHLDDVNRASQTKDMGAVDIATVRAVPAEWDKSPLIPPLLMGHTIVAKCYDGYVKFQVISVDPADESARVKYWYSTDTTFAEGTPTLQPTP
jgi:pimeloyl-ACP methyl ester carboxylesterase